MKMLVSMIYQLKELPEFPHSYFYKNHPVSNVTIVGYVTSLIEYETFCMFILKFIYKFIVSISVNDSSGTVTCNLTRETENELRIYPKIEFGEMYRIKGSIKYSEYNRKIEINISHIELCKDVNIEIEHILEVIKYTKTCYDIPFVVKNNENTDTSKNYMKIINEIKRIIFNYCYVNKTNIIYQNNSAILECIKRIRRIENVSEIQRLSINYLNQLAKHNFLEYDNKNNCYIFKFYTLISFICSLFQKEKSI